MGEGAGGEGFAPTANTHPIHSNLSHRMSPALPPHQSSQRRCIVTGGSAGLGLEIVAALLARGDRVLMVGRDQERLQAADDVLGERGLSATDMVAADVSTHDGVATMVAHAVERWGGVDVLVNVVGTSDRGLVEDLSPERLDELIHTNVRPALLGCQAAKDELAKTGGVVINVGSLAGKVGARYIGGYSAAKHALAGMTQQLRLEWKPLGIHVGLMNPGPIRRGDAGTRYNDRVDPNLPQQATKPGGGTRVRGLPPEEVAAKILKMIDRRIPDVIMPGYLRLLVAIGHLWPRLGDWLLLKFTS